ncbi:hypothetical protein GCM10017771_28500 [Streptomyces capitiformicae]|uniref:Uncharacterized protein n=1 Tax=Streptomyces capitiformicae TaxID=2014920 RepID=A0A919L993_9ACTN|nr:hypothetical protein GCM10017771_28500 [Streptomyces capitiformicae]
MPGAGGVWLVAPRGGAASRHSPAPLSQPAATRRPMTFTPSKAVWGMGRTSREGGVKERNEGITGRFSLGNRGATGAVCGRFAVIERPSEKRYHA